MAWRVEEGVDVLVCHPWLVQTGLDLMEFPTIFWYRKELPVFQSTPNTALLVGGGVAPISRIEADDVQRLHARADQVWGRKGSQGE